MNILEYSPCPPETRILMATFMFDKITIIGAGLIGSSLARAVKQLGLARHIAIGDANAAHNRISLALGFADSADIDLAEAVSDASIVVLATPVGSFGGIMQAIAPHLKPGAIVTDVGSVKQSVVDAVMPHLPAGTFFVPGHPIAGTEFSGPESGFAELFRARWCVLTPLPDTPLPALDAVQRLWQAVGANVTVMTPDHHDSVLALTSHLPHLIAFSIVNTAADLGEYTQAEVLQFSASGFRGFTRTAASDPVMWRDIFLLNKDAVLAQLALLQEDLAGLTRAIRWGDAQYLEDRLTRARAVRKSLADQ